MQPLCWCRCWPVALPARWRSAVAGCCGRAGVSGQAPGARAEGHRRCQGGLSPRDEPPVNTSASSGATLARASARRRQRAAVAEQLIARAPHAVDSIDWDTLDGAPEWMAWEASRLEALQQQVGAL